MSIPQSTSLRIPPLVQSQRSDPSTLRVYRPIDFIPLVKALHHLGETRFGNRVLRSTLGSALKLSPACPIGSPAYPDFRRYVELAERGGFVQSGYNKARDAWVRSTGKLERACAGESSIVQGESPLARPDAIFWELTEF